ncbi:armadillo-type protein [Chytriomyces sp. MP71]|nr:armadillo-type protein [Chytriomyces sp. MP71]
MINKLIRRYKYLQRKLEETLMHLLQYSSKFGAANSHKLATTVGLCVSTQLVPLAVVSTLLKEHLVKDGTSAAFLTAVFQTYLLDQGVDSLTMTLGRIGLVDDKVAEFFPQGKRSEEAVAKHFEAAGLKALNEYFKKRRSDAVKDAVQADMKELIVASKSQDEVGFTDSFFLISWSLNEYAHQLIAFTKEAVKSHSWNEAETAVFLWDTVIASVEWSTKADNFETQLVKILNTYAKLFEAFCNSPKTEISLLQRVQTVCYQDARFIKHFRTIVTTFYKHDIVSEAAVIYWFEKGGALALGKAVFLKQMEPFVEWLKAQEEESDEEDE